MFQLADAADEAKNIIGTCDDVKFLRWAGDAVALITGKDDVEGQKLFLDICTVGCSCSGGSSTCNSPAGCGRRCIALPREVETVTAVNVGGQPALMRSQLFNFHLNGPGDCRSICEWAVNDGGQWHFTYRDIITPAKLVAYLATPEDNGKKFIIYGYDQGGNVLRRNEGGIWVDGYRVPTIYGVAIPDVGAPVIARITGITKDRTVGNIRLSTIDGSGATGILLGVYEPDETVPQFRRLTFNRSCNWARVSCLKKNPQFFSIFDHVPLKSRLAFLIAVRAVKHYSDLLYAEAHAAEADAARIELEAQQRAEPPTAFPVQVLDWSNPRDKFDYDIR